MKKPVLDLKTLAVSALLGVALACGGRANHSRASGAAGAAGAAGGASGAGSAGELAGAPPNEAAGEGAEGSGCHAFCGGGASTAGAAPEAAALGGADASGAGGAPGPGDACSHTTWTATASALCAPVGEACVGWPGPGDQRPPDAIDGNPRTRYASGDLQNGSEEFVVTFAGPVTISGIALTSTWDDGPAMYAVEYSTDGVVFMPFEVPLTGPGTDDLSIPFPSTRMKAVKVKQTGTKGQWWSILELVVVDCVAG